MLPTTIIGDGLPCKQKVGFLFKRICGRIDRTGCAFCKGQQLPANTTNQYDPYFNDRTMYPGYGNYSRGYWADDYRTHSDFTDADSRSVASSRDSDFEQRLDAS